MAGTGRVRGGVDGVGARQHEATAMASGGTGTRRRQATAPASGGGVALRSGVSVRGCVECVACVRVCGNRGVKSWNHTFRRVPHRLCRVPDQGHSAKTF